MAFSSPLINCSKSFLSERIVQSAFDRLRSFCCETVMSPRLTDTSQWSVVPSASVRSNCTVPITLPKRAWWPFSSSSRKKSPITSAMISSP
jgi:hypothetical protein